MDDKKDPFGTGIDSGITNCEVSKMNVTFEEAADALDKMRKLGIEPASEKDIIDFALRDKVGLK